MDIFERPAITTATNGDFSLQLIVESLSTGTDHQITPATICNDSFKLIDMLASEGGVLCSEGAHPAPTILSDKLRGCGLIVDLQDTAGMPRADETFGVGIFDGGHGTTDPFDRTSG